MDWDWKQTIIKHSTSLVKPLKWILPIANTVWGSFIIMETVKPPTIKPHSTGLRKQLNRIIQTHSNTLETCMLPEPASHKTTSRLLVGMKRLRKKGIAGPS